MHWKRTLLVSNFTMSITSAVYSLSKVDIIYWVLVEDAQYLCDLTGNQKDTAEKFNIEQI
jgi:hypothetical protein